MTFIRRPSAETQDEPDVELLIGAFAEDRIPDRGPEYGAAVWAAIAPRLAGRSASPPVRSQGGLRWFWPHAALAGAVAGLIAIVLPQTAARDVWRGCDPAVAACDGAAAAPPLAARPLPGPNRVLAAAVQDHLERASLMLTEFNNAEAPDAMNDVRVVAEDLTAANRLYRQSADFSGDAETAVLLDDLERVLLEVAHVVREPGAPDVELAAFRERLGTHEVAQRLRLVRAPQADWSDFDASRR